MKPFTEKTIYLEGAAHYCMQKLNLTIEDILTTMNEWESGKETPTDPATLNRILENPKLENEIPQLIESQKDFPDRNISITVHYTTSIETRTPTPTVRANIHWISTGSLTNPIQSIVKRDWLKKRDTETN